MSEQASLDADDRQTHTTGRPGAGPGGNILKNICAWARAGLPALALLLMGTVFLPSPASAHQGDITAVAECQPNGTYLVTYTLSWSSVPEAAYGTRLLTREDTDGSFDGGWESQPASYQWTDRGAITSAQGSLTWTDTLPGTTLGAGRWEYAWLDWSNGTTANRFHDTRVEDLGGDCEDTTQPEAVTVEASFGDNACIGNEYTEPTLDAPDHPGTTHEVTGQVAPGSTVTVTYTAQDGYVIEGPSTFTHDYPATPASSTDCEQQNPPEPVVRDRSQTRTDCEGVDTRSWEVVREYVWNGEEWELGEPEVRNDTGWVLVRALTAQERRELGCVEVKGEQQVNNGSPSVPVEVAPTAGAAAASPAVPTAVDAGLGGAVSEDATGAAGVRWPALLLAAAVLLGLAGGSRLRVPGERR